MNQIAVTQNKANTLRTLLAASRVEIVAALPKHVTPDRMLRISLTCARLNPDLLDCTPESFLGAVIQSAQLGLEPGTSLGHAYLIPFNNKRTGKKEVQFLPGYRGLLDLVYRAPEHPTLMPHPVYDGDRFSFEYGTNPQIDHMPGARLDKKKLTHVYCVATFKDGRKEFVVMTRAEIEEIRARSKAAASSFSPWQTDYEAMALKTVVRRLMKYLPTSIELARAITLDDMADAGQSQHNDDFIKADSTPIQTKDERLWDKMATQPGDFGHDDG